ncbi:MAG: nucleoside permease [bacterium]|nr:nucleoside permease [bacterium]
MNGKVRTQLSIMMFLEFFVWGAWCVTMSAYLLHGLEFSGGQVAGAYSTTAWGAIVAPFFIGMIADKFFNAEKVLGILHLVGAGLMWWVSTITEPRLFFWALLAYALTYMPTIALTNAIAFNKMTDPEKEFPPIRVLGTIGWIVAGVTISFILSRFVEGVEKTAIPMRMAAVAAAMLGVYSFFLPKTPPKMKGQKVTVGQVLGLDALMLMKKFSFAVFIVTSFLICIPLAFYYAFAHGFLTELKLGSEAAKMSLGQASEVIFMLIMPFVFARLGVKKMLIVGMAAWAVRYACFAFGMPGSTVALLYIGILMHGVCYDFFFVTGQIYVDNEAPENVRAAAQGLIALVTYGVGMLVGNMVAGKVVDHYAYVEVIEGVETTLHTWKNIWLIPGAAAIVFIILFALTFRDSKKVEAAPAE